MVSRLRNFFGVEATPHGHTEKLVSGLGGMVAIAAVVAVTMSLLDRPAVMPVVTSIGASAVLLFAAPHGALSQPWPLIAGHLLSAAIGVTCAQMIADPLMAGPVAVGAAITAMYYTRCVHPPGGATALTAVLGGEALRRLGFSYLLIPVGLNVAVILTVAVLFNCLFSWRRYPASLAPAKQDTGVIHREDWTHALEQLPSLADVTEDDLARLHELAVLNARERHRRRANAPRSAARSYQTSTNPEPVAVATSHA